MKRKKSVKGNFGTLFSFNFTLNLRERKLMLGEKSREVEVFSCALKWTG